ncbi:MAG: peptidylprolyl isomerase, partial [Nitratireductor sp.]
MLRTIFSRTLAAALLAGGLASGAIAAEPENTMIITLKDGDVTIALKP